MKISDILSPLAVKVPLQAADKRSVIDELVELLAAAGVIDNASVLKQAVWDREKQRSTGIGDGLAIPHGKSQVSRSLVMAVGRPASPIDFAAVDGRPVQLVVLLASPPDRTADHIQALGKVSRLLADPATRKRAFTAESAAALYQLFRDGDK